LVLEIYNNGALTDYFVMEKGEGWGFEVSEELRTGDWHFQQFDTNKQVRRAAIAERCESCHQGASSNDFMFTYDRMLSFVP
jgi:Cytochrome P460